MARLHASLIASVVAFVAAIGIATLASAPADADDATPCVRKDKDFKTEMVKAACTGTAGKPGSQQAAKDAMKQFNKDHNIKSCNDCHSKLAPTYDLKDTAVKHFQELGGKLLANSGS
jgi:hypothetical protein